MAQCQFCLIDRIFLELGQFYSYKTRNCRVFGMEPVNIVRIMRLFLDSFVDLRSRTDYVSQ